jgi:hypothetical protein
MQLELSVGDSDGIKNSVDLRRGPSGSQWIGEVGYTVFDKRFEGAEMAAQAIVRASYHSKVAALSR